MTTKRKLTRRFDQAWGEDRYKHSPYYGEITQPVILLWREPGLRVAAANMTGALRHGEFVEVLGKTALRGSDWYKVRFDVQHEGQTYPQVGWLADRMLRARGKGAFE